MPLTEQQRSEILRQADNYLGTSHDDLDCSHFVWKVYKAALKRDRDFPYLNVHSLTLSAEYQTVGMPLKGDLVVWPGHVGIIIDPNEGTFIGSQTSTGVAKANYLHDWWGKQDGRSYLRLK